MSTQVTTAFVKQFAAGIRMLQQQLVSRLREAVMVDNTVVGDRAFYDQVDSTSMTEVTNRHGDTTYTDTPHRRRLFQRTSSSHRQSLRAPVPFRSLGQGAVRPL